MQLAVFERGADVRSEVGQSLADELAHRVHAFPQNLAVEGRPDTLLGPWVGFLDQRGGLLLFLGRDRGKPQTAPEQSHLDAGLRCRKRQGQRWKVRQVQRDDQARIGVNRGGEDVPIVAIRQTQSVSKVFVSDYHGIRQRLLHQAPRALQLVARDVGTILEQITYPFLVDFGRPMGTKGARQCQVHEEVPQPRRVEDIGVEEGPECRHKSDPNLLIVSNKFSERGKAFGMSLAFVRHEGLEAHPTMGANPAIFDLAFVEQLNERRPRDAEHVGSLLGRQFGVYRDHRDRVSATHFVEDSDQHLEGENGEYDRLIFGCSDDPEAKRGLRAKPGGEDAAGFLGLFGFGRRG
jgi:hypothetical protein